jgi:hypothetical protein
MFVIIVNPAIAARQGIFAGQTADQPFHNRRREQRLPPPVFRPGANTTSDAISRALALRSRVDPRRLPLPGASEFAPEVAAHDAYNLTTARQTPDHQKHAMTQTTNPDRKSFWQVGARSFLPAGPSAARVVRYYALVTFFAFEVFCITFLQKFAVPLNFEPLGIGVDLGSVELLLPLTYIAMIVLAFFVGMRIELNRLIWFSVFVIFALISVLTLGTPAKPQSLFLFLVINIPFLFVVDVNRATYRRMLRIFQDVMVFFGIVVLLQYAVELLWSWRAWPDLDRIVPETFRFVGYNYIQPIRYGSRLMKPSGVVFLEVSYVSQWTALALALEIVYFKRVWRMIFYSGIVVSLFAGTGILLILLCAPVLLARVSWRTILGVLAIGVTCIFIAIQINWYQQVNHRFTEYKHTGSSSNHRFIEPLEVLGETLQKKNMLISGEGPGTIPKGGAQVWWTVTKLAYEYGLLTTIAFFIFYTSMVFVGAPSLRIAVVLYVLFFLMSGTSIPVYQVLILIMGGLFRIKNERSPAT